MMLRKRDDEGAALITVVVLGFVMMVLVATALTVATSGLRQAVGVQRSTSALDAAFAGAQDYLARVNLDQSYIRYGNPDSTFSAASHPTVPDPWNPAFGVGSTGTHATWATIPGNADSAKYRYEADTSTYSTTGIVRLRVTGLAGERTRTLLTSLRVRGFVDYAYFTDYEIQDPATYVNDDKNFDPTKCVKYAWATGSQKRSTACTNNMGVAFSKKDIIYGDIHSNDTIAVCDTVFSGVVETGATRLSNPHGCANRNINVVHKDTLDMPSSNTSMQQDAGCLYTGPTQVTYHANGKMTIVSPWTRYTKVVHGVGSNPTRCGLLSDLHSATGATVNQLAQDALYVQDVQSLPSDPNSWAVDDQPGSVTCIGANGLPTTDHTGIGWGMLSGTTLIRYPKVGEAPATGWADSQYPYLWNASNPAYGCRKGDLYVSGTVTTLTTAASANYVYVTDDLTYDNRANDVLGLVGQNAVLVYNPMSTLFDQPMLTDFNREIDAAILSVSHTFQVQNYDRGATRGQLTVFGSIAQRFRGPTVVFDQDTGIPITGYSKAYQYDALLKTVSPPKFLAPSATNFAVTRYAGVPAAFTPDGDTR